MKKVLYILLALVLISAVAADSLKFSDFAIRNTLPGNGWVVGYDSSNGQKFNVRYPNSILQGRLVAGSGITLTGNVISAPGGGGGSAYDGDTLNNQEAKWKPYIQRLQAPINQSYAPKWFETLDGQVYPLGGIYSPTASLGGAGAPVSSSIASVAVTAGTDRSHTITFTLTSNLSRSAGDDVFTISFGGTSYSNAPNVTPGQASGPANVLGSFLTPSTTSGYRFRAAGSTTLVAGTYVFHVKVEPQPLNGF